MKDIVLPPSGLRPRIEAYRKAWVLIPRLGVFRGMQGMFLAYIMLTGMLLSATVLLAMSEALRHHSQAWQQGLVGRLSIEIPAEILYNQVVYRFGAGYFAADAPALEGAMAEMLSAIEAVAWIDEAEWIAPMRVQKMLNIIIGENDSEGLDVSLGLPLFINIYVMPEQAGSHDQARSSKIDDLVELVQNYAPDVQLQDLGEWKAQIIESTELLRIIAQSFNFLLMLMVLLIALILVQAELLRARANIEVLNLLGAPPHLVVLLIMRRLGRVALRASATSAVLFGVLLIALTTVMSDTELSLFSPWALLQGWDWLLLQYVGLILAILLLAAGVCRRFLKQAA